MVRSKRKATEPRAPLRKWPESIILLLGYITSVYLRMINFVVSLLRTETNWQLPSGLPPMSPSAMLARVFGCGLLFLACVPFVVVTAWSTLSAFTILWIMIFVVAFIDAINRWRDIFYLEFGDFCLNYVSPCLRRFPGCGSSIGYRFEMAIISIVRRMTNNWTVTKLLQRQIHLFEYSQTRRYARAWTPKKSFPTKDGNPHATVAGARTAAEDDIQFFADRLGKRVWSYSSSRKDQFRGLQGRREFYSARDLVIAPQNDEICDDHLIKLTDVDYYVPETDLGDALSLGNPAALYTMLPRHLYLQTNNSQGEVEMTATFADGVYTQEGAGSHTYSHKLWDWNKDAVMIATSSGEYIYCYIETVPLPNNRGLVFLIPAYKALNESWRTLDSQGLDLERVETRLPGLNLDVICVNGKYVISAPGWGCQIETTPNGLANLRAAAKLNPKTLSIGTVIRCLGLPADSIPYDLKARILDTNVDDLAPKSFIDGTRVYTPVFSDIEEDGCKFRGGNYMPPLIDGAFTPSDCLSSDLSCVENRILKIKPLTQKYPVDYNGLLREFATLLRGDRQPLIPYTEDEVLQDVPGAVLKKYFGAYDSSVDLDRLRYKAFQKAEAYTEVKAPRNISCVPTEHVAAYSRFTKRVCSYMCEADIPWYAFAKTPAQTAEEVVRVARQEGQILTTDFSKFDGTQSMFARNVELFVLLELFDETFHNEIRDLTDGEIHCVFRTKFGVHYNNEYTKLSGGAATSLGNTLVNAAVNYIAFRKSGLDPRNAWSSLGLYGGDDGLVTTHSPESLIRVVNELNMQIKPNRIVRGDPVDFLGRIWPRPLDDVGSFFDPKRALSKLHFTSTTQDVDRPSQALFRKCLSLFVTDSPNFLGELAHKCLTSMRDAQHNAVVIERVPWLIGLFESNELLAVDDVVAKYGDNPVFPAPEDPRLCFEYFVHQTELPEVVVTEWLERVMKSNILIDDNCLLRVEAAPTIAVEVDGQVLGPKPSPAPKIEQTKPLVCRDHLYRKCPKGDGKCKYTHVSKFCRDFANKRKCSYGDKCKYVKTHFAEDQLSRGLRPAKKASPK